MRIRLLQMLSVVFAVNSATCVRAVTTVLDWPATQAVQWTHYDNSSEVSWNDASAVCAAKGGSLPAPNTHLAMNALRALLRALPHSLWSGFWIGLHSPDEQSLGAYAWERDCSLQPATMTFWTYGSHNVNKKKRCGRIPQYSLQPFGWKMASCKFPKSVICEFISTEDPFYTMTNYSLVSLPWNVTAHNVSSSDVCSSLCMQIRVARAECVAAVFHGHGSLCKILLGQKLLDEAEVHFSQEENSTAVVRNGFDLITVQNENVTVESTNDSTTPLPARHSGGCKGCLTLCYRDVIPSDVTWNSDDTPVTPSASYQHYGLLYELREHQGDSFACSSAADVCNGLIPDTQAYFAVVDSLQDLQRIAECVCQPGKRSFYVRVKIHKHEYNDSTLQSWNTLEGRADSYTYRCFQKANHSCESESCSDMIYEIRICQVKCDAQSRDSDLVPSHVLCTNGWEGYEDLLTCTTSTDREGSSSVNAPCLGDKELVTSADSATTPVSSSAFSTTTAAVAESIVHTVGPSFSETDTALPAATMVSLSIGESEISTLFEPVSTVVSSFVGDTDTFTAARSATSTVGLPEGETLTTTFAQHSAATLDLFAEVTTGTATSAFSLAPYRTSTAALGEPVEDTARSFTDGTDTATPAKPSASPAGLTVRGTETGASAQTAATTVGSSVGRRAAEQFAEEIITSSAEESISTMTPPSITHTSSAVPTSSKGNQGNTRTCCVCGSQKNQTPRQEQETAEKVKKVKKELSVIRSSLSKTLRAKTSAPDHRASSRCAGGIAIVTLITLNGLIVLFDFSKLLLHCVCWKRNRSWQRREFKETRHGDADSRLSTTLSL